MTDLDHGADLRERFDRAMRDLDAPDGLTAAALTDGHRLRRRRRILTVSTAVAAAAAVTALVTASLGGSTPSTGPQVATDPPAPTPSRVPPTDAPLDPDARGWWSMPARIMALELASRLPDGMRLTDAEIVNTDPAPGEPRQAMEGYLTGVLRPAEGGPGKINMVFYAPAAGAPVADAPEPGGSTGGEPSLHTETDADGDLTMYVEGPTTTERTTCDPEWLNTPVENCTELTNDDGEHIGRVLDSTVGGVRSLSADLLTADGGVVLVNVANTLDDKWPDGATPSAEDVPLDLAALREIAEDPVWTAYQP
jgi:hypothetical protein